MKVLVCGGRDYQDMTRVDRILSAAVERLGLDAVVQGGATGADALAKQWASDRRIQVETFYADWKGLGKSAGPARNQKMLDEAKPEVCIAFPGGAGTADMVRRAQAAGIPVHLIDQPLAANETEFRAFMAQRKDRA